MPRIKILFSVPVSQNHKEQLELGHGNVSLKVLLKNKLTKLSLLSNVRRIHDLSDKMEEVNRVLSKRIDVTLIRIRI